jgi:hypothetical protein
MLKTFAAALLAALLVSAAESAFAQQPESSETEAVSSALPSAYTAYPPPQRIPSLSYNYYYPSYGSGQYPARMYLCPVPVPEYVGYTWITYQALAPHEFMHPHQARYGTYHPGSGWTFTSIRWW